ncbi:MAG: hypothetical protein IV105_24455 [Rhizobacter sp.]|nr:hypothetical protein [Rhizobacter sp.]
MNARWVWLLWVLCGVAHADDAAQRQELKRQRAEIEAQHAQREEACRKQFVVTPCLEKVRVDKQAALATVRTQELALDEAQRRQRAEAQAQRVADKAKEAQARHDTPASAPRPHKAPPAKSPKVVKAAAPKASAPERGAAEKRKQEAFEARQREIQAHREAVIKRNTERAARKPPKPLPVPASAASRP